MLAYLLVSFISEYQYAYSGMSYENGQELVYTHLNQAWRCAETVMLCECQRRIWTWKGNECTRMCASLFSCFTGAGLGAIDVICSAGSMSISIVHKLGAQRIKCRLGSLQAKALLLGDPDEQGGLDHSRSCFWSRQGHCGSRRRYGVGSSFIQIERLPQKS